MEHFDFLLLNLPLSPPQMQAQGYLSISIASFALVFLFRVTSTGLFDERIRVGILPATATIEVEECSHNRFISTNSWSLLPGFHPNWSAHHGLIAFTFTAR